MWLITLRRAELDRQCKKAVAMYREDKSLGDEMWFKVLVKTLADRKRKLYRRDEFKRKVKAFFGM